MGGPHSRFPQVEIDEHRAGTFSFFNTLHLSLRAYKVGTFLNVLTVTFSERVRAKSSNKYISDERDGSTQLSQLDPNVLIVRKTP